MLHVEIICKNELHDVITKFRAHIALLANLRFILLEKRIVNGAIIFRVYFFIVLTATQIVKISHNFNPRNVTSKLQSSK